MARLAISHSDRSRDAAPPIAGAPALAALALIALVALGCATVRPAAGPAPGAPPALGALAPEELGTQRLLRAQYDGPEGRAGFKLVLRLEAADRFDLTAVDAVGRTLWRLQARGADGLFEDPAAERFCTLRTAGALPGGLALDLPLAALPRLLLGRLPVEVTPEQARGAVLEDGPRRWTWSAADGALRQWTLWQRGEPAVWWSRRGAEATLSVRARATQVRWQGAVTEPIGKPLGALRPTEGYAEGPCGGDLP